MPKNQGKSHSFLVLKGRQNWKTYTFFSKELFLQVFPGHKKSNFDNSAAIFLLKSNLFSLIVQKISQKIYKSFRKTVFVQMFLWTLQCSFDTPVVLSFAAVKFSSVQTSKKGQKCTHFSRITFIIFPRSVFWTRELHFWQRRRNKSLISKLFSTQSSKLVEKNLLFQKKLLSLRMILVTHGMQYWRHVGNFWWSQSFTCSNLEKGKKTVKEKRISYPQSLPQDSLKTVLMTLPKFFLLILLKSEVLSVRFQNRSKKVTSISIIRSLPNGSFGHVKGFFDKLSTVVLVTPNCFIQNGNCSNRITSFWKNCIVEKKIHRTRNLGFRQSCRTFQAKNRRLHFQGPHWWREFFFQKL